MNNIHKNKFNLVGSNLYFTTKGYNDIFLFRAISLYNITRIKNIENVTRCRDNRSAKSIETR